MRKNNVFVVLLLSVLGVGFIYLMSPLPSTENPPPFDLKDIKLRKSQLESLSLTKTNQKTPHIILILVEGLSQSQLSCYGNQLVYTPNLDAIAKQGVRCTASYSPAPAESPATAALLTGKSPACLGYELNPKDNYPANRLDYWYYRYLEEQNNWQLLPTKHYPSAEAQARQGLPLKLLTLGEILKTKGYQTAIIGEWRMGYAHKALRPRQRGFDYQYGAYASLIQPPLSDLRNAEGQAWRRKGRKITGTHTPLDDCVKEAVKFIENHHQDPFFLYLPLPNAQTETKIYLPQLAHVKDQDSRQYYAQIKALDANIAHIHKALKKWKIQDNTLLIFASSNGSLSLKKGRNTPLKGGKYTPFEGGINVPLMIQWMGKLPQGLSYHNLVSLTDILPTLVMASGEKAIDNNAYEGVNLLPFLQGSDSKAPHYALFWRIGKTRIVRKGDWKLIIAGQRQDTLLYNIKNDEAETQNLALRYQTVTVELIEDLKQWESKRTQEALWTPWRSYRFKGYNSKVYDFIF